LQKFLELPRELDLVLHKFSRNFRQKSLKIIPFSHVSDKICLFVRNLRKIQHLFIFSNIFCGIYGDYIMNRVHVAYFNELMEELFVVKGHHAVQVQIPYLDFMERFKKSAVQVFFNRFVLVSYRQHSDLNSLLNK
jgi:hypothetical protein